ncbi:tetratricopeptide repeat protein [Streptomyces sp. NPDC088194]|uniref:tetratricopeptide repeat protein n=1 Tax=Streptomyces sp. NPDC088194 TaxID=3154931 RepID=UPI0034508165
MNTGVGARGGSGRARAGADVGRCRALLVAGDLPHAAVHLGRALFHDPGLASAYTALDEIVVAAGSSEAARELFKGDGTTVFPGNAAATIALIAEEGRVPEAVELLASVVAVHPERPWAAAPWFSPELGGSLPLPAVGGAVSAVWGAVEDPAPPEVAAALAPWLALAREAAARPDCDAGGLRAFSALARRLGAHQEAVTWCLRAEEREVQADGRATQLTLILLGSAHRGAGQPERAIEVWKRAVALAPGNADVLLDLADITLDQGDVAQSLRWAERAVAAGPSAADPTGAKYRAAVLAARYRAGRKTRRGGDTAQLTTLIDLAVAHPEVGYLRTCVERACEDGMWLRIVPPPTEAVCSAYGYLTGIEESHSLVTSVTATVTALEAPTPTALCRARFPAPTTTLSRWPQPDPRLPVRTDFGPPLWSYRGTEPVAAAAPPSPAAVALVHQVAGGVWAEPLIAYDRAAAFAELDCADLLGLLAHMPPPRDPNWRELQREHPLYWERFAQVWVCVGILHHRAEEPWAGSTRRTLLLRLLFGPDDWTVDAAAFALCVAAWRDPEQRAEIAEAIARRYQEAAAALGKRPTGLHDPLAALVLICPGIDPEVARRARRNLRAAPWTRPARALFGKRPRRKSG